MRYRRMVVVPGGGPEAFRVVEEELPDLRAGWVRVKVLAAGVAFGDVLRRTLLPGRRAYTPGYDIVGVVEQAGAGVTAVAPGEVVAALPVQGGYAEYLNLPEGELIRVPAQLDPAEAVCMVLNYVTAYQLLHRVAQAKEGERVLVQAAAGGVGTALLQLGRLAGLEMYGTASAGKHALVRELGATPIDYRREDVAARLRALGGVDIVLDGLGGGWHLWQAYHALRAGGQLICYGFSSAVRGGKTRLGPILASAGALAVLLPKPGKRIRVYSVTGMKRRHPEWYREDLRALFDLLGQGKIKPVIYRRLPLTQAGQAHALLERGESSGKIVLLPGEDG